jgi:hypothetical protein
MSSVCLYPIAIAKSTTRFWSQMVFDRAFKYLNSGHIPLSGEGKIQESYNETSALFSISLRFNLCKFFYLFVRTLGLVVFSANRNALFRRPNDI